jgi:hypothetical protein
MRLVEDEALLPREHLATTGVWWRTDLLLREDV